MATVALTASPTQLDAGTTYDLVVLNSGSSTVHVQVDSGNNFDQRLSPGQSVVVYPHGLAVTAYARSGSGQVTVTTQTNPQSPSGGSFVASPYATKSKVRTFDITAPGYAAAPGADAYAALTAAMTDAADAATSGGAGIVIIPPSAVGTPFLLSQPLTPLPGVALVGMEAGTPYSTAGGSYPAHGVSQIKLANGVNADMFSVAASNLVGAFRMENLRLDGNKANQTAGCGLKLPDLTDFNNAYDAFFRIYGCYFRNFKDDGIYWGLYRRDLVVADSWVMGCGGNGIHNRSSDCEFRKVASGQNTGVGLLIKQSANRVISGDFFQNAVGVQIQGGSATGNSLLGVNANLNQAEGIYLDDAANTILGGSIYDNSQAADAAKANLRATANAVKCQVKGVTFTGTGLGNRPGYHVVLDSGSDVALDSRYDSAQARTGIVSGSPGGRRGIKSYFPSTFAQTFDASTASTFIVNLTANVANGSTIINGIPGDEIEFQFVQDGTGSRLYGWVFTGGQGQPTFLNNNTPPTLTTTPYHRDIVRMRLDVGGTWREIFRSLNGG